MLRFDSVLVMRINAQHMPVMEDKEARVLGFSGLDSSLSLGLGMYHPSWMSWAHRTMVYTLRLNTTLTVDGRISTF